LNDVILCDFVWEVVVGEGCCGDVVDLFVIVVGEEVVVDGVGGCFGCCGLGE